MDLGKIEQSLGLLADHLNQFPVLLQVRLTEKLCLEQLGLIGRIAEQSDAASKMRRFAMSLLPWASPGEETPTLLDTKCPSFVPILNSICAEDTDADMGEDDEQLLNFMMQQQASAFCHCKHHICYRYRKAQPPAS